MTAAPHDAEVPGEQGTDPARPQVRLDATYDNPVLRVFRTAEWVPPAYRQAYLDGAAAVLGVDRFGGDRFGGDRFGGDR